MKPFVVIGAGPAGLMAADVLSALSHKVVVLEQMPSAGRRLLMAGRGGLNLTHSEPLDAFIGRYGAAAGALEPIIRAFPPSALIAWAEGLGQACFTGSSGRVFPKAMKASPLLRALLARLAGRGVELRTRAAFCGFSKDGDVLFEEMGQSRSISPRAVLMASGGASWPRLGDGGGALDVLRQRGVAARTFVPSNVGVLTSWSGDFAERFQGQPLKACRFSVGGETSRAEAVITRRGLEGGAIYALGSALREALQRQGTAALAIDLKPDLSLDAVRTRLAAQGSQLSTANRLRRALKLGPLAVALLRQGEPSGDLAADVKALSLSITATEGLERAISSAGGVAFSALTPDLELKALPGVFAAGEMLDYDAPTGGYLLQAAFATGRWAGLAMAKAP